MAGYNPSRFEQELLAAHEQSPSSFTVKLYPEHWHINSGSKCLYNSPIASLLDDIRDHRIPVDFMDLFEAAKAPFYDGCMIVELQDYRSAKNRREVLTTPETTRVVLRPNAETLWADIRLLNQKAGNTWSDHDALEIEARLLLTTSSPLCLEPDVHLTRVANHILRDASPQAPLPLKRKVSVMNEEDEESERARRLKIIQFMNPRYTKPVVPNYRILDAIAVTRSKAPRPQPPSQPSVPGAGSPQIDQVAVSVSPAPYSPAHQPATVAPSVTAPPVIAAQPPQKKAKKLETAPSPLVPRTSATPAPPAPLPIPPHLQQHHQGTAGDDRSSSPSQSPRTIPNVPLTSRTPVPEKRPASAIQQVSPRPTPPHPQALQPQPTAGAPQPLPQPQQNTALFLPNVLLPNVSSTGTLPQAAMSKKPVPQPNPPPNTVPNVPNFPQAAQPGIPSAQAPNAYAAFYAQQYAAYQQQREHNAAQQRLNQAQGQLPPGTSRSPMPAHQTAPQHSSPLAANRPLARSPMPPNTQQVPQPTHPPQQQPFNYQMQNQFSAAPHLRPHPHPQVIPHHMTNGTGQANPAATPQPGQTTVQDQTHVAAPMMPQYPQMYYGPPQMNLAAMQAGRMPAAAYWQMNAGRGAPVANGQHPKPMSLGTKPNAMQGS